MTDEQMRDLVKDCGFDWHSGYMPLFDDCPTNRFAVLIESVEAAERERWTRPQTHCLEGDCTYYGQKRPASCACSRASNLCGCREGECESKPTGCRMADEIGTDAQ